jgi:hypothetical protein
MKITTRTLGWLTFLAVAFLNTSGAQTAPVPSPAAASSMERKLQHVVSNGKLVRPDPSPTDFSDQEVNSYFAAGKVKLPAGVQSVTFQTQPGMVGASAQVNFDQIKAGRNSGNPLLSMFSGIHTVVVVAHAHGEGGQGFVHVDSVILDDNEIPPIILQLFVQKFVQPKYPNIGIDSKFSMPDGVDSATIGQQKSTLIQK